MKQYNKLIRDKIPEIIESKDEKFETHIANDSEYWLKLIEKLKEETSEFEENPSIDELSDILEVIDAISDFKNFDANEVQKTKSEKLEKRGGFEKRLILDWTE